MNEINLQRRQALKGAGAAGVVGVAIGAADTANILATPR